MFLHYIEKIRRIENNLFIKNCEEHKYGSDFVFAKSEILYY
jgi:hypothetical protein